ncbi:MAG: YciC family protein [Pyrinomonadaceae bacterium]
MNNPVCATCGHVNRIGAVVCEACDARPYAAGGADPTGAPFDASGGSSWGDPETQGEGAWGPGASIPAPPFKSVGDVLSPMLAVYRKHFTLVGILVLVTTLPQGLLQYYVVHYTESPVMVGGRAVSVGPSPVGAVLLWLLMSVGSALLSASLVYAVVDLLRAGRSSAGACLSRGLKALPNVFLLSLLYSLVTGVGFVLFIVPGIICILMFAVRVPAAVLEGRGPVEALKRSHALTGGYKGLIFITYFLWWVLTLVLNWVLIGSFGRGGNLGTLPTVLIQTAASGMLNSSLHVLTVYVYLGLLREHGNDSRAGAFAHGPEAAAG